MDNPFAVIPLIIKACRPSRTPDMAAVSHPFWLGKGYHAMTFFGKIITHSADDARDINQRYSTLKNHEMIHLRQAQACGDSWLRFYWKYLGYWWRGRRLNSQLHNAGYLLNPFEMEAYEHEHDHHYPARCAEGGATGWQVYAQLSPEKRLRHYHSHQKRKKQ